MSAALPRFGRLEAGPGWQAVDLLSDLHLHQPDATFALLRSHLLSTQADAVILLGDVFEAWVGDDQVDAGGFASDAAALLREAAQRRPLYFMHGNRDFLVGERLAAATGIRLLDDPTVLAFGAHRWLLSHGDALCLGDTDYLRLREQVRGTDWIAAFLARPLAERNAIADDMRARSRMHQQALAHWSDVDADGARAWLAGAGCETLVHGHTHHPGHHDLGAGRSRIVLSDWDARAVPPRGDVLRLHVAGHAERLAPQR
jgi:UDP-2,3-diacylglucosamine hydrolase